MRRTLLIPRKSRTLHLKHFEQNHILRLFAINVITTDLIIQLPVWQEYEWLLMDDRGLEKITQSPTGSLHSKLQKAMEELWYFKEDPKTCLNHDEPNPGSDATLSLRDSLALSLGRLFHDIAFEPEKTSLQVLIQDGQMD